MKVISNINFKDLKENIVRKKGDIFEISEERYKDLNNSEYAKNKKINIVEIVKNKNQNQEKPEAETNEK